MAAVPETVIAIEIVLAPNVRWSDFLFLGTGNRLLSRGITKGSGTGVQCLKSNLTSVLFASSYVAKVCAMTPGGRSEILLLPWHSWGV